MRRLGTRECEEGLDRRAGGHLDHAQLETDTVQN